MSWAVNHRPWQLRLMLLSSRLWNRQLVTLVPSVLPQVNSSVPMLPVP